MVDKSTAGKEEKIPTIYALKKLEINTTLATNPPAKNALKTNWLILYGLSDFCCCGNFKYLSATKNKTKVITI